MTAGSVDEFEAQRSRMFGLAYRLLGSAEEAEDIVQDAFLRWSRADRAEIAAPSAWLAKVVTNLSLSRLTSARARRERYVGPWLPEPVLTADGTLGPLETAEQRDSVSLALLVLMERLTPAERAVFVLREAFGYSHREIAEILAVSEANSRQLHRRAAHRLDELRPRFRPRPGQWHRLVERFLAAARDGDLDGLERLLAAEVTWWGDGGGKVPASRRPVSDRSKVARLVHGLYRRYTRDAGADPRGAGTGADGDGAAPAGSQGRHGDVRVTVAEVNGEPALLAWSGGGLLGVLVLEADGDRIRALWAVANPDKLGFAARQAARVSHPGVPAGP